MQIEKTASCFEWYYDPKELKSTSSTHHPKNYYTLRYFFNTSEASRLRFDFSHHKPLEPSEIEAIEKLVNSKIRENLTVQSYEVAYEEIKSIREIKQFFGEKYGQVVRVIDLGESKELCGGTHTSRMGNIGYFRILKEASIAAGTRRIEAVTGEEAEDVAYTSDHTLAQLALQLNSPVSRVAETLEKFMQEKNAQESQLKSIESAKLQDLALSLKSQTTPQGVLVVSEVLSQSGIDLKEFAEVISKKHPQAVIALGAVVSGKAQILVRVPQNTSLDASALLKEGLSHIQGKGGGRKEMAQGAGPFVEGLEKALHTIVQKL